MDIIDLFKKGYEFEELEWISYQEIDDWDSLEKERKEVSRFKKMRGKKKRLLIPNYIVS